MRARRSFLALDCSSTHLSLDIAQQPFVTIPLQISRALQVSAFDSTVRGYRAFVIAPVGPRSDSWFPRILLFDI